MRNNIKLGIGLVATGIIFGSGGTIILLLNDLPMRFVAWIAGGILLVTYSLMMSGMWYILKAIWDD